MTEQTQPTDAELIAFATEEQFLLFCDPDEFTDIARAVLAKWGTPAGAGGRINFPAQEPLGEQFQRVLDENRWELYAEADTPQPTQAQAGAVPMSEKFLQMMTPAKAEPSDFAAGVRFAEAHHGIKGADHVS